MTLKHLSSFKSISINGPTDYAKNATSKWIKDHKSANDKQGIANSHHLVISTEFNKFFPEISPSEVISTKKLLNSVYTSLIDVCLQV